jgi:hypothetical protein
MRLRMRREDMAGGIVDQDGVAFKSGRRAPFATPLI